jgi:transposase
MRKIIEVLRLRYEAGLSSRNIARSLNMGHTTVDDTLARARAAGLSWPLPEGLGHDEIEQMLYPPPISTTLSRPEPDWQYVHAELSRKGVTLQTLWIEYKTQHADGYQYSRFCDLYWVWRGMVEVVMHQTYHAGEKIFVDYAGMSADVIDRSTGEVKKAQIFVAVLGTSNYTYAEATWTQSLEDWIGSHCRAFEYFGGVTQVLVPDNTRTGVSHASYYEPDLNPTCQEMATYYGTAVVPARPGRPRDRAKAESAVLVAKRLILAYLRNRRFFSLGRLNEAIR